MILTSLFMCQPAMATKQGAVPKGSEYLPDKEKKRSVSPQKRT